MGYVICAIVFFWVGWRIGRKYQDFSDLMLARRVAKLVDQRDQLTKERQQYEDWQKRDERIGKIQAAQGVESE